MTLAELENKMAVLLGGRAAEMLIFGEYSTGAADDLAKATEIARAIVTRYGMYEKLGMMSYENDPDPGLVPQGRSDPRHYSEETAREIDCALRDLVGAAFDRASRILTINRAALEAGAQSLLERETLTADELPEVRSEEARTRARA